MKTILIYLIALFCVLNANEVKKVIDLYESPTCGCCELWAQYLRQNDYKVNVHKSLDFIKVKEKFDIKDEFQSCHTGIIKVGNREFALEGHLPLSAIEWLVENNLKNAIGISTLGMPQGSPGMEQGKFEEYPVVVLYKDDKSEEIGIFKGDKVVKSTKIK